MTEQRLKDLLEEMVADVPAPDGRAIDDAWQAARRRSRRSHVLAAASVAAFMVAGTAVVAETLTDDGLPSRDPATSSPSASERQSPSARPTSPDATYGGVPVWWAPPASDEGRLDWFASSLPRTIDLSAGQPPVQPGEPALAVYSVHDAESELPSRFIVVSASGETRDLAADQIEVNRDEGGNAAALTPFNGGLSPDGWHLFVAQQGSIELYDFQSGSWTTIDTPQWRAEGARWLDAETIWVPRSVTGDLGATYDVDGQRLDTDVRHVDPRTGVTAADEPYGIWVDSADAIAGSYFLAGPVEGGPYTNPEAIVARTGNTRAVLALGIDDRHKGCCPVTGWLSDDVLAFESGGRVLAWRVATGTLYRVSELTGIDREAERADSSWAWHALG